MLQAWDIPLDTLLLVACQLLSSGDLSVDGVHCLRFRTMISLRTGLGFGVRILAVLGASPEVHAYDGVDELGAWFRNSVFQLLVLVVDRDGTHVDVSVVSPFSIASIVCGEDGAMTGLAGHSY